jgi:NAD(P)-dependent dehydrogenase (short-subunit alcohol dehydrogenase family)
MGAGGIHMSNQEASGLVVLITGAASGIGAATARLLAASGARLVLHSRADTAAGRERLAATVAELRNRGAEVLDVAADLTEAGAGAHVVSRAMAHFGRLDQIVANAGFADKRATTELTRADFDRSFDGMAGSLFEIVKAARSSLIESALGRVVFVSSFVAHRFVPGGLFPASASAKAAGEALVKTLAIELAPHRVTVNCVAPGYTRKDHGSGQLDASAWEKAAQMTPLGRIADPADVAGLIAFLLSERGRHITGQTIAIDGGLTLGG